MHAGEITDLKNIRTFAEVKSKLRSNPTIPFETGLTVTQKHCILSQTLPDLFGLRGTQPELAIF